MNRTWLFLFNMFVMQKNILNEYCEWLFSVLEDIEDQINIAEWSSYEARVYGFLSERLFNIWLEAHQNLYIEECEYLSLESQHWAKKIYNFLNRKFIYCKNKGYK